MREKKTFWSARGKSGGVLVKTDSFVYLSFDGKILSGLSKASSPPILRTTCQLSKDFSIPISPLRVFSLSDSELKTQQPRISFFWRNPRPWLFPFSDYPLTSLFSPFFWPSPASLLQQVRFFFFFFLFLFLGFFFLFLSQWVSSVSLWD